MCQGMRQAGPSAYAHCVYAAYAASGINLLMRLPAPLSFAIILVARLMQPQSTMLATAISRKSFPHTHTSHPVYTHTHTGSSLVEAILATRQPKSVRAHEMPLNSHCLDQGQHNPFSVPHYRYLPHSPLLFLFPPSSPMRPTFSQAVSSIDYKSFTINWRIISKVLFNGRKLLTNSLASIVMRHEWWGSSLGAAACDERATWQCDERGHA